VRGRCAQAGPWGTVGRQREAFPGRDGAAAPARRGEATVQEPGATRVLDLLSRRFDQNAGATPPAACASLCAQIKLLLELRCKDGITVAPVTEECLLILR